MSDQAASQSRGSLRRKSTGVALTRVPRGLAGPERTVTDNNSRKVWVFTARPTVLTKYRDITCLRVVGRITCKTKRTFVVRIRLPRQRIDGRKDRRGLSN